MIDFRKVGKIVVHPGHAHRDDFLFTCFVLAMCKEQGVVPVVHRRDPTEAELKNPYVVVGDVGERHEPELSNFDHHQFSRDHAPTCALTLLLKDMAIYDESLRGFRWLTGWLSFALTSSVGAIANVGIASIFFDAGVGWVSAALAGVAIGAIWNYGVNSTYTWGSWQKS